MRRAALATSSSLYPGRIAYLLFAWVLILPTGPVCAAESSRTGTPTEPSAVHLNLPESFVRHVEARARIDRYAESNYGSVISPGAGLVEMQPRSRPRANTVTVLTRGPASNAVAHSSAGSDRIVPPRGYRVPLGTDGRRGFQPTGTPAVPSEVHAAAAALVEERLAYDGVMVTLAKVLRLLEPIAVEDEEALRARMEALWDLGFPVDLLAFFRISEEESPAPAVVVAEVSRRLAVEKEAAETDAFLQSIPFAFVPTDHSYRAAAETGGQEIRFIRLQLGGGYRDGIVMGGNIDVVGQVVEAFPEARFMVSLPAEFKEPMQWLATSCWSLRRAGQMVLIAEPFPVSGWVQDNGKAGFQEASGSAPGRPMTLAPRFACRGEIGAEFLPGDSLLMEGLRAAGHEVAFSPLQFQGGNLLVAETGAPRRRLLLLSETEIYRNTVLGLTRDQVLAAFRAEFGVDEVVRLPSVSYHLDYDVTLRLHDQRLLAFVNDPLAAAGLLVQSGLARLGATGILKPDAAASLQERLKPGAGDVLAARADLLRDLEPWRDALGRFKEAVVQSFKTAPVDDPAFNLRCFMSAVELLGSSAPTEARTALDEATLNHFRDLRHMQARAQEQVRILRQLPCEVIPVPSMPNLFSSVNYLNGLQETGRFIMPVAGGFHDALDRAARDVYARTLGESVKLVPIQSAHSQARHGAIHCLVAAYPYAP